MELSAVEFDVLREHLGVEEFPVVLRVPSPGRTEAERARLVRAAWATLSRRGVADYPEVDPRLAAMLAVLARPQSSVDVRVWGEGAARALAAIADGTAVLAVLAGTTLTLSAIDDGLPRHALSVLPRLPAGPGRSVTLPSADLAAAAPAPDLAAALRARGVRADDATHLAEMIAPLTAQGQFGAAHRDRYGKRHRTPCTVSFFDTAAGRYLQLRTPNPDGEHWTTVSPADHRALLRHLDELFTARPPGFRP
ncbi:ESX secretion-associated protein EspG [Actinokineospora fastidiosa]|uniref:ESX secretion-associated protein EspG n=1 Tax=Actinokineospora fastidiosa TaxID=1816 RepID=UPI001E30D55A|nr:ESX secretion-associated protein EspG [Actinokineospora fastidiosa]